MSARQIKENRELIARELDRTLIVEAAAGTGKERNIAVIVHHWRTKKQEGSTGWRGVTLERNCYCMFTVVAKNALGTGAAVYECLVNDQPSRIRRSGSNSQAATTWSGISVLNDWNDVATVIPENATRCIEDDLTIRSK